MSNLSGFGWEENLNWEIAVDDECKLSERQLLALCLWERTFYGFSPEQQSKTFKEWDEEAENDAPAPSDMDNRRELIADICCKYPDLDSADLGFMLSDYELSFHSFIGLSDNVEGDIEYIRESISAYSDLPAHSTNHPCIALVCIPAAYNVSSIMFNNLRNVIEEKTGCSAIKFHTRMSSESEHLTLTLLYEYPPYELQPNS